MAGVSLRRFRGKGFRGLPLRVVGAAGLTGRDAARGARAAALLSRLLERGGATGPNPERVSAAGRKRSAPARAGFVPGPTAAPRGRLCVLLPLVPGAVTPISVRGDLREPVGGAGRLCGEGGGARRGLRRGRAPPGARVVPVTRRPLPPQTLLGCPPCFAAAAVGIT